MTLFLQQIVNGATTCAPLMLISLALGITLGYMRAINVGLAAFLVTTSYVGIEVSRITSSPVIVFVAAVVSGSILAVILELIVLAPMRRRATDIELGSFVATFAVGLALEAVVQYYSKSQVVTFNLGFATLDKIVSVDGLSISLLSVFSTVFAVIVAIALMVLLRYTSTGKILRALAADWEAAEIVGVRLNRVAILVAVTCGAMAGCAGFISAASSRSTSFNAGDPYLLLAFVVAVVGGVTSIRGIAIAAIVISTLTTVVASEISSEFSEAGVFALLFVALVLRPQGFGAGRAGSSPLRGSLSPLERLLPGRRAAAAKLAVMSPEPASLPREDSGNGE